MDRMPVSFVSGRTNIRALDHVGNVGTPVLGQYSGGSSRGNKRRNRPRNKNNQPYFSDRLLLNRVKKYLEETSNNIRIDFDHMVHYFQTKFREYSNRKHDALKGLLHRAHDAVMEEFRVNAAFSEQIPPLVAGSPASSEDYGDDDDGEMMDSYNDSGSQANNQLMSMYGNNSVKRSLHQRHAEEQEELINISSSDEGGNETKKVKQGPRNEPKPILPLLPTHILSVIRKTDADALAGSVNGGANHTAAPKLPNLSEISVSLKADNGQTTEASRKRKAAEMTESRKVAVGSSKKKREVPTFNSKVTFKDFGGNAKVLTEVCKLLLHMRHPEVYRQIGVSPPRGFLLHGPPGCGKTLLAQAIAGELQVPLIKVASPELVAGVSGESEERVRELFAQALASAPCVLFLDEVDAITPNRHTAQREMERRIVAQLLSSLDELGQEENGDQVLVIGATNRPDAIDPALRRAGRFDREVCLGIPDLAARRQILKVLCGKLRLAEDLSFEDIARNTPGFVGADLMALTREAAMAAVNRVFGQLKLAAEKPAPPPLPSPTPQPQPDVVVEVEEEVKLVEKPTDEVILVADEPKAKEKKAEDKDEVVDVDVDDSSKEVAVANGKPEEDKMDVCEVVADNSDCVVLDEKPNETEPKDNDPKVKEPKDKEPKDKEPKSADSENATESKPAPESKPVPESREPTGSKEPTEAKETPAAEPAAVAAEDAATDTGKTGAAATEVAFGPDLAELISWLHADAPLTPAQLSALHVERADFELALKAVQPSAKREGFATVPDVTWDDVGALADIRDELQMAILAPVKHAERFAALGLTTPTGVLLCGPPGCGKTFLAKAVANEAGINFISVKGPELLNMYVGESERAVRQCFQRARNSAPCVIFFDELDALCPKRSDSGEGGASMRVVNQMLTEMDGVEGRKDVYLMAATNRPDIVDPAVLRPGRLDKILYVGMPSGPDRVLILQALTKGGTKPTLSPDVCLRRLGECAQTNGYTGADLAALVREAGMQALREFLAADDAGAALSVADGHFTKALAKIRPSVSEKDRKYYEKLREIYTAVPGSKAGL